VKNIPDGFCILPWIHLFVWPNGQFRLCCVDDIPIKRDSDNKIYSVQNHSIDEWWNSPYLQNIRQQMLLGLKPAECSRCYRVEESGGTSKRIDSNTMFPKKVLEVLEGKEYNSPNYLELRPGNLCNLKCRMCNPTSSSQLFKEYEQLKEIGIDLNFNPDLLSGFDWFSSEVFDDFKKHLAKTDRLALLGGEPLIMQQVLEMLEFLVHQGFAKDIVLRVVTNCTVCNDKLLKLLSEFKEIKMSLSLDGIGGVNDYIRYPSSWKKIEENTLRFIDELPREKAYFDIQCTFQIYNSIYIPELIQWYSNVLKSRNLTRKNTKLYFNRLFKPEEFELSLLPISARTDLIKELEEFLLTDIPFWNLDMVVDILKNIPCPSEETYNKFWWRTDSLDTLRPINFEKALPKLHSFLINK
jgi:sulfatase maturation enzyme AslB (radical SAM superfamily)